MTTRYAKGKYTGNYKKTIGVDFMEKSVELRDLGETVNLMIWDTAGQEEFDALTSRYYKGAGAVIYVFSTVDRDSFDDLPRWKRKVEEECGRICQVLVQNKIDLVEDAAMSRAEVEDMADYMNIRLFRSCVQDNVNVKEGTTRLALRPQALVRWILDSQCRAMGVVFEHICRQFLKYGGTGGSDDALSAVADISTLSELAGPSKHHHSSSKDSHQGERRSKREVSDRSESRSESPSPQRRSQQQRHTGSRAPNGAPFPPSVPAPIATERENHRLADEDEGSNDDNGNGSDADDQRDNVDVARQRSSPSEDERCQKSAKTRVRRDTGALFSVPSATKEQRSTKTNKEGEHRQGGTRADGPSHATKSARFEHGALAQREDGDSEDDDVDTPATNTVKGDAEGDRDAASDRTTKSEPPTAAFKLQPSKRRTNGKKRQSVPECMLS